MLLSRQVRNPLIWNRRVASASFNRLTPNNAWSPDFASHVFALTYIGAVFVITAACYESTWEYTHNHQMATVSDDYNALGDFSADTIFEGFE